MPTARFSTDRRPDRLAEWRRATADVRALLVFRLAGLRGRSRRAAPIALSVLGIITVAVAVLPALLPEYSLSRHDVADLLPPGFVSVLVISIVSSATSGGGRELMPREQAVAFPLSPTTDHLGALVMAPLNIAWLLQGWALVAATSYAVGPRLSLVGALVPVFGWLVAATVVAQTLAWGVEWVRRGPHGSRLVRGTAGAIVLVVGGLVATGTLSAVVEASPTRLVAHGVGDAVHGRWWAWSTVLLVLVALTVTGVAVGAWAAGRVAGRQPRDELRVESSTHPARPHPRSDLTALMRTDRASIWRSVPMRRGMLVLAVFPGLVAVGGSFRWDTLGIFPGLVGAGGALLFGVNAWCIDGRGALWRDSLPVPARLSFWSRALVLLEILLVATVLTLLLASLRAGVPTVSELASVGCATVVVTVQVVATALRWSVRHPYAVDLRSARATPAPPLVMVGYSARLALTTTFTGLLFNVVAVRPWSWSLILAVPFLVWSGIKLRRTARAWADPATRSRVIATVAS